MSKTRHEKKTPKSLRKRGLQTPAQLGFRMPAEWETHEATWIAWPHNRADWPSKLSTIHWVYGEIVRKLARGETVRILVNSKTHGVQAKRVCSRAGADLSQIQFLYFSTDRGWTRDFGPIFVKRDGSRPEIAVVRFRFNGWARYTNWKKDDAIPRSAAKTLKCRIFPVHVRDHDAVLEGGSIEVNGRGTLITTEECLLDPIVQTRNPGLERADLEETFRTALGITNVLWLGRGIVGDDTHGHVDDLCRFVDAKTVVLCQEKNRHDDNYQALAENRERLECLRLEDGSKLTVVPLPMPTPLFFDGHRLPASYANFYISNAAVLVPTFNDSNDYRALGILSELFKDRQVVGIHAVDLVWGFGTIHCLTQQQPSVEKKPVASGSEV